MEVKSDNMGANTTQLSELGASLLIVCLVQHVVEQHCKCNLSVIFSRRQLCCQFPPDCRLPVTQLSLNTTKTHLPPPPKGPWSPQVCSYLSSLVSQIAQHRPHHLCPHLAIGRFSHRFWLENIVCMYITKLTSWIFFNINGRGVKVMKIQ